MTFKSLILPCLLTCLMLSGTLGHAQRISSEDIPYTYNRLPLISLNKSIKNYQVIFDASYEAKNQALIKDYETAKATERLRYEKEMDLYPALVKAEQARYDKELAEYKKKSLGQKIIEKQVLEVNSKPVKVVPYKPYLREPEKPILQSSYDYKVLASTYINLEGFESKPADAIKISVLLYGFDYTQPRTINVETKQFSTSSTTNPIKTSYHNEFSYRHPMAIKVAMPDGKEILSQTPAELNLYKVYKTGDTDRPLDINRDLLIKKMEEQVLQDNLKFLNNLLNDKFGFSLAQRTAKLFFIKKAGEEYADLTLAFNEAAAAFPMLQQDASSAKEKLIKAAEIWKSALSESNINDKKARIDKDVTLAVCHNLLETYFALGSVSEGKVLLDKMNSYTLSYFERKTKNEYETLFTDLKTRQQTNQ